MFGVLAGREGKANHLGIRIPRRPPWPAPRIVPFQNSAGMSGCDGCLCASPFDWTQLQLTRGEVRPQLARSSVPYESFCFPDLCSHSF